jgi:hypothetical protein
MRTEEDRMRRLSRMMAGMAMLVFLVDGCGSTGGAGGDDALVLQFIQWDNTNLTQADQVRESSADVDVVQDICSVTNGVPTFEPFTQTLINAVFQNNEGADILLQGYSTQISNQLLAQADIPTPQTPGNLSTTITGGRCSNGAKCVINNDCGLIGGTCDHTETTVSAIVLFDFFGKAIVATVAQEHPEVLGQATPMTVTFFGSDSTRSFQITVNYLVTFADFDNCASGGGAGAS